MKLTISNRLKLAWEVLTVRSGHGHTAQEKQLSTFMHGYVAGWDDRELQNDADILVFRKKFAESSVWERVDSASNAANNDEPYESWCIIEKHFNLDHEELETKILQWHKDRNLIDGSTDKKQFEKLLEEVEELRQSIEAGVSPVDDIGDIIVVLVNIAARNNLSLEECTEYAYNSIKTRTGRMVDGIFIKDGD